MVIEQGNLTTIDLKHQVEVHNKAARQLVSD
jgi:hypothetical protein